MRRFYCDRCTDEIKDTAKMRMDTQIPGWLGTPENAFHFCNRCWTEFLSDLKKWFGARGAK